MSGPERTPELAAAYQQCRTIAKREAKNFYYGFLALPRAKRDAMCAVYAFMRRADDISDDESLPLAERRSQLALWLAAFHAAAPPDAGNDAKDEAVFLAVRDVQQKYGIDDALLGQLVQGTAMDLRPEPPPGVRQAAIDGRVYDLYETVEALESYCYLVASVVGLVTIRIFGYRENIAEQYAVDLGKAFQFTNILRDVREDAERGRVYLPEKLLHSSGSSLQALISASRGASVTPELLKSLQELGARAEHLYLSADALIPLLEADSRPAMHVLVHIYRELLHEIQRAHFKVFTRRIRVSAPKKVMILMSGFLSRHTGAA